MKTATFSLVVVSFCLAACGGGKSTESSERQGAAVSMDECGSADESLRIRDEEVDDSQNDDPQPAGDDADSQSPGDDDDADTQDPDAADQGCSDTQSLLGRGLHFLGVKISCPPGATPDVTESDESKSGEGAVQGSGLVVSGSGSGKGQSTTKKKQATCRVDPKAPGGSIEITPDPPASP